MTAHDQERNGAYDRGVSGTATAASPRPPTPLNFNLLGSLQSQLAAAHDDPQPVASSPGSPPLRSSHSKHRLLSAADSPSRKHDSAVGPSESTARFESYAGSRNSLAPSPALTSGHVSPTLLSRKRSPQVALAPSSPPSSPPPPASPPVVRRQASHATLAKSIRESPSLRRLSANNTASRQSGPPQEASTTRGWKRLRRKSQASQAEGSRSVSTPVPSSAPPVPPVQRVSSFYGISVDIPKADLNELREDNGLQFSNRGSVFIDGKKMGLVETFVPKEQLPQMDHMERARKFDGGLRSSLDVGAESDTASFHSATAGDDTINGRTSQAAHVSQEQAETQSTVPNTVTDLGAEDNPPRPPSKGLQSGRRKPSIHMLKSAIEQGRVLSAEEMSFSMRIRSMYDHGDEKAADWNIAAMPTMGAVISDYDDDVASDLGSDVLSDLASDVNVPASTLSVAKRPMHSATHVRPSSKLGRGISNPDSAMPRPTGEVAGGLEDYDDISGRDVDRYGFIRPSTAKSRVSVRSHASHPADGEPRPAFQRVSTSLAIVSDAPRRGGNRKSVDTAASRKAQSTFSKQQKDARSLRTQGSLFSVRSGGSSLRSSSSGRTLGGRGRKVVSQASDMLTLPPGLEDIAEQEDGGRTAGFVKEREWAREEKWRKMAIVRGTSTKPERRKRNSLTSSVRTSVDVGNNGAAVRIGGGGMRFDFDTTDARVVSRTWKGIPDRWRAVAWHSYLSASRRRRNNPGESDEELMAEFRSLQLQNCGDDVQIDVDVPRTIGMHVMFRRRYRGGQRLLFRVLHAVALKFPEVGYVQGMASLATTLLCYFDEEMSFVMLVRLWELRGLKALFASGFGGLMSALAQFEGEWLGRTDVAAKLEELGIGGTAYGTRWYLTLFNMSIPFPAQLRVWDVFMLLGDAEVPPPVPTGNRLQKPMAENKTNNSSSRNKDRTSINGSTAAPPARKEDFGGADLDVLHATSAALIDATREILLDSDFENAMKVLTSWIPVKDEDLLMRVAKAEWKAKKRRSNHT